MSETKNAHDGVVTSIADTDLVMVVGPQGGLHPVSFANLMKAVRGGIQIGGRNLLLQIGETTATGCSWANGKVIMSANADSHFFVKVSPSAGLKVGETYTVSFDCEGLKSGDSWVMEGVAGASAFKITMTNGRNRATFVMNQAQLSRKPGYFMFDDGVRIFPNGFSTVTLSNFKLERGNIATDWTPAPEDIASGSWGGLIGYLPITYNLAWKGGAHESDENACGKACVGADGHLAFGSLDAIAQFCGSSCGLQPLQPVIDSDRSGFRDYTGDLCLRIRCRNAGSRSRIGLRLRYPGSVCQIWCNPAENYINFFEDGNTEVCERSLVGLGYYPLIAERKEVAV